MARTVRPSSRLARFQRVGDVEDLLAEGTARGMDVQRLRACIDGLAPVLAALSFGEQPAYDTVQPETLPAEGPELEFVVRSMAGSTAADLRAAGLHVMAMLDREAFIAELRKAARSRQQWERIEAIRALGGMRQPGARPVLLAARRHSDPHTAREAAEALARYDLASITAAAAQRRRS